MLSITDLVGLAKKHMAAKSPFPVPGINVDHFKTLDQILRIQDSWTDEVKAKGVKKNNVWEFEDSRLYDPFPHSDGPRVERTRNCGRDEIKFIHRMDRANIVQYGNGAIMAYHKNGDIHYSYPPPTVKDSIIRMDGYYSEDMGLRFTIDYGTAGFVLQATAHVMPDGAVYLRFYSIVGSEPPTPHPETPNVFVPAE